MKIRSVGPQFLEKLNVDYLKPQIETGHANRTKKALQQICKLYRSGFRVRPDQLSGMEQSIVGLIYTQRNDEKVRRWALNADPLPVSGPLGWPLPALPRSGRALGR
jgi:hypothetical protein